MPKFNDLSEQVIGAAIEVHRHLGAGCAEITYQRALSIELGLLGIAHELEVPVQLTHKGHTLGDGRIDVLVNQSLVVELKTVDALHHAHMRQVLGYLRARNAPSGLLINFSQPTLRDGIRRIVN